MTSLTRFMDLPALACTSNLHEPHQHKNHSLNDHIESNNRTLQSGTKKKVGQSHGPIIISHRPASMSFNKVKINQITN